MGYTRSKAVVEGEAVIKKIRNWLYWHDWAYLIIAIITMAAFIILTAGYLVGKGLQYNCNLDKRPSMYTSLMINDNPYAYDPEGFCTKLKEKLEKE